MGVKSKMKLIKIIYELEHKLKETEIKKQIDFWNLKKLMKDFKFVLDEMKSFADDEKN